MGSSPGAAAEHFTAAGAGLAEKVTIFWKTGV
jgi:hypothetical protein